MKCIACGACTSYGTTTDVTDLGNCLIVIRNVPCHKCIECDETIYTFDVAKSLEIIVASAKLSMNEIAVVNFSNKVA